MLSRLATNDDIVGLHLSFGGQLVAQALADDSFMFLRVSRENLEKGMLVWNKFALASSYILIRGSLISYHVLKGFGMFRMTGIRGEERLYFLTLGLSIANECYKWSID